MSELRQNLATREWVVIAPERGLKPKKHKEDNDKPLFEDIVHSDSCPFCPGNDDRFPNVETFRTGAEGVQGWSARSIENKFKILQEYDYCPTRPEKFTSEGIYLKTSGMGYHDVIVEHSAHNKIIATMTRDEVENIIGIYHRRYLDFSKNPNNLLTTIFKNHGVRAGASQPHPHSQMVGSRVVPNHTRFLLYEAQKYFDNMGVCVHCEIVKYERKSGNRIVCKNDDFISIVPYAAEVPYEINILPLKHNAGFDLISDKEMASLADILRQTLSAYYQVLDNPDFNYVIYSAPYTMSRIPYFHWHIEIMPRLITPGGFETGTRISVNPTAPEDCAKNLYQSLNG